MTDEDLRTTTKNIFAYHLLAEPLPGHRVQHDRAFDYIIMGLYQATKPQLAPTVTVKDFAKHVMVVIIPHALTFEIHAPEVVNLHAPQMLHFTRKDAKFGVVPYALHYVEDYAPRKSTAANVECTVFNGTYIRPTGLDIRAHGQRRGAGARHHPGLPAHPNAYIS